MKTIISIIFILAIAIVMVVIINQKITRLESENVEFFISEAEGLEENFKQLDNRRMDVNIEMLDQLEELAFQIENKLSLNYSQEHRAKINDALGDRQDPFPEHQSNFSIIKNAVLESEEAYYKKTQGAKNDYAGLELVVEKIDVDNDEVELVFSFFDNIDFQKLDNLDLYYGELKIDSLTSPMIKDSSKLKVEAKNLVSGDMQTFYYAR